MPLSTIDTASISGLGYGFKNRIINGGMQIDQRNAGASVTPTVDGQYGSCDRWSYFLSQVSKFSVQQNAGSVTPPAGYVNYLGVTSLSAYSVTSTDYFSTIQKIEGLNVADLGWGTASAATVTLSFWVRSSLTGTFGAAISNGGYTRSYPFSYTISAANTWTQISVTIPGDTSGTWLTTNGQGLVVQFCLGAGSTRLGTANTWAGTWYNGATGATSVVGTSGATFYITGVQLETGTVATSFDWRPYGTELALCQRYFSSSFVTGTAPSNAQNYITNGFGGGLATYSANNAWTETMKFPVSMRTTPTMTYYSVNLPAAPTANQWVYYNLASWNSMTSTGPQDCNQDYFNLAVTGTWSANVNFLYAGAWAASAEL